jgi:predicted negative regulator of RcsB-dependent stress response
METTQKKSSEKFKITGSIDALSKKLKAKYPQLTDADLKFESGKEDEMIGRLEKKLSKSNEEVIEILNKLQLEKV